MNPSKLHVYMTNLIKERFGVFLEIRHSQYPQGYIPRQHTRPVRAITDVWAYRTPEDARHFRDSVAHASACCGMSDQFVRAKGIEVAMKRLYRKLAALNS